MANNRMYLVCAACLAKEETEIEECIQYLAKYYPNCGWYIPDENWESNPDGMDLPPIMTPNSIMEEIKKFLEIHGHRSLLGDNIRLMYEGEIFPRQKEKQRLITALGEDIQER